MTVSDEHSPEHGEQRTHTVDSSSCSSSRSSDGESENGDSDNQSNLRNRLYPGFSETNLETVLLLGSWFTQYSGVTENALESLFKLMAVEPRLELATSHMRPGFPHAGVP